MTLPIAVALDLPEVDANLKVIRALSGRAPWFKVGLRMLYDEPAPLVAAVRDAGARLFVDAKLHDIPATVRGAAQSLARWNPDLLTVHASGGREMVAAAREGLEQGGVPVPRVVVVTRLTSQVLHDEDGETIQRELEAAFAGGAVGGVCSALEVRERKRAHPGTWWVTPGIRPAGGETHDQARVATPAFALREGADLLVVGRPLTFAQDPATAWDALVASAADEAS